MLAPPKTSGLARRGRYWRHGQAGGEQRWGKALIVTDGQLVKACWTVCLPR